jgi:hypothetical protein
MLNSKNNAEATKQHDGIPKCLGGVVDPCCQVHRLEHIRQALYFPALKSREADEHHRVAEEGLDDENSVRFFRLYLVCFF